MQTQMPPERRRHRACKTAWAEPRSLIKNIPSKSEPWKAPVKDWLREIEAKRGKK